MSKSSSRPPRLSNCFGTAMRKASRRMTQLYDDALAPCGLRSTQYSILAELSLGEAAPTLAELAAALVMDRSSIGHTLRPLERDGYVTLAAGTVDRRERRVMLTPLGQSRYDEARRLWQMAQDKFTAVYGAAQSDALRQALLNLAHDDRLTLSSQGDHKSW